MSRQFLIRRVTLLILLLSLLAINLVSAQQPVFRIGILDNDRGPISNGARLAVQEINAAGGVRGADGTSFRLELVIQPTNFGINTEEAVNNLNQADIIAALGPESSTEVLNTLPQLQNLNVPVITPAMNDTIINSDTTNRLFRSRAAQILNEQALASFLINDIGLSTIVTVQLDLESSGSVIGFSSAATALGVAPKAGLLLQQDQQVEDLAAAIIAADAEIAVTFGAPAIASALYNTLRESDWTGLFAFDQVEDPTFRDNIPLSNLNGIFSVNTWSFATENAASITFLNNFIRMFGTVPGPVEAASYDSVYLLAEAIAQPGELQANLGQLSEIAGVQGVLSPNRLAPGETSNNVTVMRLGAFGTPQVVARYAGGVRLPEDTEPVNPSAPDSTATPEPTATPDGVVITISARPFQNVRSGPGTEYEVIGQVTEGTQIQPIGSNRENTWVVVDFRGRQGWLSVPILEVFGDLNSIAIIDPPPTPTPGYTPTPQPSQEPNLIIESATVSPSPIIAGQPFNVNVVIRNAGATAAGEFAIAATFPPNSAYAATIVPGLGAGQSTTATLSTTLSNTGSYSVMIIVDLNNQVPGEKHNLTFNYSVDHPVINQGNITLDSGGSLDINGDGIADVQWTGSEFTAISGAVVGIISGADFNTVHWDLVNPGTIDQGNVQRTSLNAGYVIGIITGSGHRGVIRINDLPGGQAVIGYRAYQN